MKSSSNSTNCTNCAPNNSDVYTAIHVPSNRKSCFVSFATVEGATRAFQELDGKRCVDFGSRNLHLAQAKLLTEGQKSRIECTSLTTSIVVPGLIYVPNIITHDEEELLLQSIDAASWQLRLKRRVQHYSYTFDYSCNEIDRKNSTMPMPKWICEPLKISDGALKNSVTPDQLTVNEYLPGQGIAPHIDTTNSFVDGIGSICLSSTVGFQMKDTLSNVKKEIPHHRRSLVMLTGSSRYTWTHAIAPRKSDVFDGILFQRGRRVSLTFRKIKECS
eukprot:GSMAST32.ASY1.ANO1.2436.1 assembled CDS